MKRFLNILLLIGIGVGGYFGWNYWREHRFDSEILAAARRYEVDPSLVKAVVWRESRFNPGRATGSAGELGLMQIREAAAMEWAATEHLQSFQHEDCLNPATNTLIGAWYLKRVMSRYKGTDNPIPFALADYNAGRSNVLKWQTGAARTSSTAFIQLIGFPSTKSYVESIIERDAYYQAQKSPH